MFLNLSRLGELLSVVTAFEEGVTVDFSVHADAVETLGLFAEYLGRVAGDLALVFMARGGVYLTGGITQKILPFFDETRFRAGFENKAPHEELIAAMPTYAILHEQAPLEGLAAYARTPSRFGVALEGRHWKR